MKKTRDLRKPLSYTPYREKQVFINYNRAVTVRLESVKETTEEKFKEFLLRIHKVNMTEPSAKPSHSKKK